MFFYANDDGDGGSGDNDEQVNMFPFSRAAEGKIKCHILKKEIKCVRDISIPGSGVHSCGVSANCRGDDYLLLGGRVA